MSSAVGLAPPGEAVEPFGASTIDEDGVIGGAGDVGGEGHFGPFGQGRLEPVGRGLGPELDLDDGPHSPSNRRRIDYRSIPGNNPKPLQPADAIADGCGREVDALTQFSP